MYGNIDGCKDKYKNAGRVKCGCTDKCTDGWMCGRYVLCPDEFIDVYIYIWMDRQSKRSDRQTDRIMHGRMGHRITRKATDKQTGRKHRKVDHSPSDKREVNLKYERNS